MGQPVGPGGGPLRRVAGAVLLVDDEDDELLLGDGEGDAEETDLTWDRIKRSALFLTRKKRPDCPSLLPFRPLIQTNINVKTANVASKTVVADTKTAPAAPAPEPITDELSTIKSSILAVQGNNNKVGNKIEGGC